jgi:glyoxylase-like metal-dependent hydrolase (beta-lactamase superfamily II)
MAEAILLTRERANDFGGTREGYLSSHRTTRRPSLHRQDRIREKLRVNPFLAAKDCDGVVNRLRHVPPMPPGHYPIQSLLVSCHLLVDGNEAVLLDTGLVGEPGRIRRLVRRLGLAPDSVKAVLLTHGHLDHAGNVAWVKQWTGARVFAHPAEQAHIDGRFPYRGVNRWCGRLERAGRFVFGYRRTAIDEPLADGQVLPFWGGLRVVHLPGHTAGHCGFFSERHGLLFSGDLFVSYRSRASLPPPIFNSFPELIPASLEKVRKLDPPGIVPSHYWGTDWTRHRRKFAALCARLAAQRRQVSPSEPPP